MLTTEITETIVSLNCRVSDGTLTIEVRREIDQVDDETKPPTRVRISKPESELYYWGVSGHKKESLTSPLVMPDGSKTELMLSDEQFKHICGLLGWL